MTSPATGVATAALSLVLAATLAGCSGAEETSVPRSEPAPSVTSTTPAPEAGPATRAKLGRVVGQLPRRRRKALVKQVTPVVDDWFDAAYVGGTWPRTVSGAFGGFTADAAKAARRDRRLTTNAALAGRIDGVRTTRRSVRYDVLAVRGRPVGVTARVVLKFRTTGEKEKKVSVQGRLTLTRRNGGWKVFGYDLRKGER